MVVGAVSCQMLFIVFGVLGPVIGIHFRTVCSGVLLLPGDPLLPVAEVLVTGALRAALFAVGRVSAFLAGIGSKGIVLLFAAAGGACLETRAHHGPAIGS